jgi:molybdopterin synthase catalytic subunit
MVLFFAAAREHAGTASATLNVSEEATVADVKICLAHAHPRLAPWLAAMRIAVNNAYAPDDAPIPTGAEVAVIPPVSGG